MVKKINNVTVNGLQYRAYRNKNGKMVAGYNVYFVYPLMGDKDTGYGCGVCYATVDYVEKTGLYVGSEFMVCEVGFGKDSYYEILD